MTYSDGEEDILSIFPFLQFAFGMKISTIEQLKRMGWLTGACEGWGGGWGCES